MKLSIWTPPDLVGWIRKDLKKRALPGSHRLEAEYLVSHALKISRLEIYLNYDKPCSIKEREQVKAMLRRRQQREPLAYIIGSCEFWSLNLITRPGVLIPRQDSEILVEVILDYIPNKTRESPLAIIELGTGTGAIPLAISLERKCLEIITIEKSASALPIARQNIENYKEQITKQCNKISLVNGDAFESISMNIKFDFIVSNPPYISSTELLSLQEEVKKWEPEMALDGGEDGLDFYRYLFQEAAKRLNSGGYLIVEHGFEQRASLQSLSKSSGELIFCDTVKDVEQRDRV
ncbi:MAG: peptide chain release factor N(5)-glutamine methyltransferase, partial [Proteobacteria bacterium]|nr:peptide chain release factor N(5)-glutamine methyltransferase [Pseudomonadota bacterium]